VYVDWASNILDRKSTSDFMFSFKSGALSWNNNKQTTIALSSTKVKYKGATMVAYQIIWL
jgi:hypothetical protein